MLRLVVLHQHPKPQIMSKIWPYILVLLVGIIATFFLMGGCGKANSVQSLQDSIRAEKNRNAYITDSNLKLKYAVYLTETQSHFDSITFQRKLDSQSKVIAGLQGKFKITKDSIMTLYTGLKTFYDNHDTVALFATYADLRDQLNLANNQLFAIQISRDSLDYSYKTEVGRLNGVIDTLQVQLKQFNDLLVECTTNAAALAKNGQKAVKRAKLNGLLSKVGIGVAGLLTILLIVK